MTRTSADLEVIQTSSPAALPKQLQYLINTEQAVSTISGSGDSIVCTADLEHLYSDTSVLVQEDWWMAHYNARIDSYSISDLRQLIWGWHVPGTDTLESNSAEPVRAAKEEADREGAKEVGFRSGLVVYGSDNELSNQIIAHTNYSAEPLQHAVTLGERVEDAAYRLVKHPEPGEMEALHAKNNDSQRNIIFRDAAILAPTIVTAVQGLHAALDARFIELLKDHKIDQ